MRKYLIIHSNHCDPKWCLNVQEFPTASLDITVKLNYLFFCFLDTLLEELDLFLELLGFSLLLVFRSTLLADEELLLLLDSDLRRRSRLLFFDLPLDLFSDSSEDED